MKRSASLMLFLALTIMGFVATFLIVPFLPALYALWFRRKVGRDVGEPSLRGKTATFENGRVGEAAR